MRVIMRCGKSGIYSTIVDKIPCIIKLIINAIKPVTIILNYIRINIVIT